MRNVKPSPHESTALVALQEAIEDLVPKGHILGKEFRMDLAGAMLRRLRGVDDTGAPMPRCKYFITPWGRDRKRRKSVVRRDV
jgi:hypothetical protein